MLGSALVRVRANSPRFAMIYRGQVRSITVGKTKGTEVQILSGSTQLMAYGMHPSGVNIEWEQDRGPGECSVAELSEVDADSLMGFLDAVCDILQCERKHRFVPKPGRTDQEFLPWTIDDIKAALSLVPNDDVDYETWLSVAYAVWSAAPDDEKDDAFEAWEDWSAKSDKHNPSRTHKVWHGIHRSPPRAITAGTLVHHVREATGDNNWLPLSWSDFGDGFGPEPHNPFEDDTDVNTNDAHGSGPSPTTKRDTKNNVDQLILDPKNPIGSATEFIKRCYQQDGISTLHHSKGEYYRWQGNCYRPWPKENLYAQLNVWLHSAKRRLSKGYFPFQPTIKMVGEVLKALTSIRQMDADLAEPAWLCDTNYTNSYPVKGLIACRNVLLDLRTMEQLPHTPELFNVNALNFGYDAEGVCPQWGKFFSQLWTNDKESIEALQEFFGLCLTSDMSFQKMLMLIGPRRSGKGTIAKVLIALLGQVNTCSPTLDGLSGRFGMEALIGKLLAVFPDVRLGRKSNKSNMTEKLLSISGGDRLSIERKNKTNWNGTLTTRMLMLCNELPILSDVSGALPSRFIMLQLTKSFLDNEDRLLAERLMTELPGILNWAIVGWKRLMERGYFVSPVASDRIRKTFNASTATLRAFIERYCELGEDHKVVKGTLFKAYATRIFYLGLKAPASNWFGRNLNAAYPRACHQLSQTTLATRWTAARKFRAVFS